MRSLLFVVPMVAVMFEYVAVSASLAYARYSVEMEQPVASLLGGLVRVGENLPYDAVPNAVITLHVLTFLLGALLFIYAVIFGTSSAESGHIMPPQES